MIRHSSKYEDIEQSIDPKTGLLRNKLGIKNQEELERIEEQCLVAVYRSASLEFSESCTFTEKDICCLYHRFLGTIYEWAGSYRTIDISSDTIRWCHARCIPSEMERYSKLLKKHTPFTPDISRTELLHRLAEILMGN